MGLIQREVENSGIPTVSIFNVRKFSNKVKPPRAVFLDFPTGHALGEPFNEDEQRIILVDAFIALYSIETRGTIIDLPYQWKVSE